MIVAHYGRAPPGGGQLSASGAAALHELRGYYSTGASPNGSPGYSDEECEALGGQRGRRRQPQGEVELMTRQQGFASPTPSYDRLRRRNYSVDLDGDEGHLGAGLPAMRTPPPAARAPLFAVGDAGGFLASGLQDLRDLQRRSTRWKDQVLAKLKRVGSQPALGSMQRTSIGYASDAGAAAQRPGSAASVSAATQAQPPLSGAPSLRQRGKEGRKAD